MLPIICLGCTLSTVNDIGFLICESFITQSTYIPLLHSAFNTTSVLDQNHKIVFSYQINDQLNKIVDIFLLTSNAMSGNVKKKSFLRFFTNCQEILISKFILQNLYLRNRTNQIYSMCDKL